MGLFSIFSKNKQDSSAQDSGRFSRDDDDFGQQARSKRASHANESGQGGSRRSRSGGDPMLPEKKRARRRLVGAIALALAAAVGLPMLLDAEPRPLAGDIDIKIPSKEKAPPLPMPSAPVAAADSVDEGEEVIAPPPLSTPSPRPAAPVADAQPPKAVTLEKDLPASPLRIEPDVKRVAEPKVAEPKPEPKPVERKLAEKPAEKPADKPADKPAPKKPEDKPAPPRPKDSEAARALALLEGKAAAKPAEKHPRAEDKAGAGRYVVQVAALASQDKATEMQARLRAAGVTAYTEKAGSLVRVRVGPFGSREEADKARAKVGGNVVAE
jgi:DedD protein